MLGLFQAFRKGCVCSEELVKNDAFNSKLESRSVSQPFMDWPTQWPRFGWFMMCWQWQLVAHAVGDVAANFPGFGDLCKFAAGLTAGGGTGP